MGLSRMAARLAVQGKAEIKSVYATLFTAVALTESALDQSMYKKFTEKVVDKDKKRGVGKTRMFSAEK